MKKRHSKERPIIFSAPMVRAILEGRKTQTRRVNKRQDEVVQSDDGVKIWTGFMGWEPVGEAVSLCPFGVPDDRLWVRETFCIESSKEVAYNPPHKDGRPIRHLSDQHWGPWWEQPHYRATDPAPELDVGADEPGVRWKSPIFMPHWASRITLEITSVRVERLQAITDEDARAEGIRELPLQEGQSGVWWAADPTRPELHGRSPVDAYAKLWRSIHGPDSWEANPWVWVLSFRKLEAQP